MIWGEMISLLHLLSRTNGRAMQQVTLFLTDLAAMLEGFHSLDALGPLSMGPFTRSFPQSLDFPKNGAPL
jgi:hypothetical protein